MTDAAPKISGAVLSATLTQDGCAESPHNECPLLRKIERCRREIDEAKRLLRAGHPDVEGLCLALADWSGELRILERIRAGST
jgi:hypothetical protein